MESVTRLAQASEFAQVFGSGLEQAIKAEGMQDLEMAISESSRDAAQKSASQVILTYQWEWEAKYWVAATQDVLAEIAVAASSDKDVQAGEAELREQWRALLNRAAGLVQASFSMAAGRTGTAPGGQFGDTAPNEASAIFALELKIGGKKFPVFLGVSKAFLELWTYSAALVPVSARTGEKGAPPTLDLLLDVELPLSVSFGRTYLPVRDILKLSTGSIVELNCPANEFVDVIVNNCTIARGEVVVIEGNYGVRIEEIISRRERMLLQHKKGLNPHRPMRISA